MSKPKFNQGEEIEIKGHKYVVAHVSINDNPDIPVNFTYELWDAKEFAAQEKLNEEALEKQSKSKYAN